MNEFKRVGGGYVTFDTREHAPLSVERYELAASWGEAGRIPRLSDVPIVVKSSLPVGMGIAGVAVVGSEDGGLGIELQLMNVLGSTQKPGRHVVAFEVFERLGAPVETFFAVDYLDQDDEATPGVWGSYDGWVDNEASARGIAEAASTKDDNHRSARVYRCTRQLIADYRDGKEVTP